MDVSGHMRTTAPRLRQARPLRLIRARWRRPRPVRESPGQAEPAPVPLPAGRRLGGFGETNGWPQAGRSPLAVRGPPLDMGATALEPATGNCAESVSSGGARPGPGPTSRSPNTRAWKPKEASRTVTDWAPADYRNGLTDKVLSNVSRVELCMAVEPSSPNTTRLSIGARSGVGNPDRARYCPGRSTYARAVRAAAGHAADEGRPGGLDRNARPPPRAGRHARPFRRRQLPRVPRS